MKLLLKVLPLAFFLCHSVILVAQTDQPNSFGKGSAMFMQNRPHSSSMEAGAVINQDLAPFYHGVASGDPLEDRVIIWTRVTPDSLHNDPIEVKWQVATDTLLTELVANGTFVTDASRDYTVKIDVTGLDAGQTYYYGFSALQTNSITGKTKTTPSAEQAEHLKFGVVSCSNYQGGYFNAYGKLAERTDLDAILHLGDYIYEYGDFVYGVDSLWNDRLLEPSDEIVSLFDYRARYSTYRLDSNLLRMHQQHPIIAVWDDHESANDSYTDGAENHQPDTEGDWESRKMRARQVYFEWMPIRDNSDSVVYRTIKYGNLADLIMLDTRLEGREQQINDITDTTLFDPNRTMLGSTQKAWLFEKLSTSTAKWKIIGQQVIFSSFNVGWAGSSIGQSFEATESLFLDIWDGYPAERQQIVDFLSDNEINDVVLLTGDFHSSFAFDVAEPPVDLTFMNIPDVGVLPFYNPSPNYDAATGEGSVAVEFATPSITSANFDENTDLTVALGLQLQINNPILLGGGAINLGSPNPHMKYVDLIQHGYFILDIKPDSTQADYFYTPILAPSSLEQFNAGYYTLTGENHLAAAGGPTPPKAIQDIPAPIHPPNFITSVQEPANPITVLSVYPNPATEIVNLQFANSLAGQVSIKLLDVQGRTVQEILNESMPTGLFTIRTSLNGLSPGTYYLQFTTAEGVIAQPIAVLK